MFLCQVQLHDKIALSKEALSMRRITAVIIVCTMMIGLLTACGNPKPVEPPTETSQKTELVVFAAASMTETLEEIAKTYETEHSNIKLTFNFDSSGTLKTQIEEGAPCDLFISAAAKQMDGLNDGGYIDAATRIDLLENKVALCVAENSKSGITSYEDMKSHLEKGDILMAMGNEDVPVGQYTQKIFAYFGLDEKELSDKGVLTYGSNVKEVTTQISEGTVDCGVIYQTDAYSAGLKVSDTATEEMCGKVIYPAAVLKNSAHADEIREFLAYLQTEAAGEVFSKVGFTPIK